MANRRDLSEPLLLDILLFLPVISLVRFKTICKSWCSIIESSTFITQHLCHNSEKNNLICACHEGEIYLLTGRRHDVCSNLNFECKSPKNGFKIVNSCNGIVCLAHYIPRDFWLVSLWNPATKQMRELPKPSYLRPSGIAGHTFALGFNKKTNDYKIVRIILDRGKFYELNESLVEVYNMRSDSWRIIHKGSNFPIAWIDPFIDVACNSEMCIWIGGSRANLAAIFYFGLADEVYGTVPLPDNQHFFAQRCSLAFLSEKITYIKYNGRYKTTCPYYYEIWRMDEFGKKESWNKIYKLQEPVLPCASVGMIKLSKNGEFILTTKAGGTDKGLYLYDLVTQEETLLLLGVYQLRRSIINYSESLVSVESTKLI